MDEKTQECGNLPSVEEVAPVPKDTRRVRQSRVYRNVCVDSNIAVSSSPTETIRNCQKGDGTITFLTVSATCQKLSGSATNVMVPTRF